MLSNIEKIDVVNQHIRSVNYALYNAELDKVEAIAINDSGLVIAIDERIANLNLKIAALEEEKASLTE